MFLTESAPLENFTERYLEDDLNTYENTEMEDENN